MSTRAAARLATVGLTALLALAACGRLATPPSAASGAAEGSGPGPLLTVTAVGDLMIDASAAPFTAELGFGYPFEATADLLRAGDLTIANLEGPLARRGRPEIEKQFTFRVPTLSAHAMRLAGIDAVTLANNHTLDQGPVGLEETLAVLQEAGIAAAGAGPSEREARRPIRLLRRGLRIALLSYSNTFPEEFWAKGPRPGTAYGDPRSIEPDVRAARREADVVLVAFHWGAELAPEPKEYQVTLARLAVDAGADAVLGTHPHTLQGIEWYRGAPIFYSLGNFAFGSYSARVRDGVVARLTYRGRRGAAGVESEPLWEALLVPIDVFNPEVLFQPRLASGDRAAAILDDLARLSASLGTRLAVVAPPPDLPVPGPVGLAEPAGS